MYIVMSMDEDQDNVGHTGSAPHNTPSLKKKSSSGYKKKQKKTI